MAKARSTVFEYLEWRGDISFSELSPCEVDSLIFSLISYIDFDGIVPSPEDADSVGFYHAARQFVRRYKGEGEQNIGLVIPKQTVTVLARAAKTKRFSECRLLDYVNHICDGEQKQFSALSFSFRDKEGEAVFVAFRGTDDTIVGWKENFNMSFMQPVPSQLEAAEYLRRVADKTEGNIYVGGHSKGGNLAVFSAVKAPKEIKERIAAVYNLDGPGFDADFISGEDYAEIREKIRTIVPQSSIVGMLLEHEENYAVIKSDKNGLLQHNGFNWEVKGGSFVHLDSITEESRYIDETLKKWLAEMSHEERRAAVDSIYEALTSGDAKTLTDLNSDKKKLVKAWGEMSEESRAFVRRCVSLIVKNSKG